MSRRFTSIVTTLLTAGLFVALAAPVSISGESRDSFRFVFMPDIHMMPELRGAEGFAAAIAKVNELAPDFVITGGDMVYDALGVDYERADSLYRIFGELCGKFEMPVHHTIGNHEIFGLYTGSGVDPTHPEYGRKMFEKRLGGGSTNSSFDFGGWHFIMLDTIGFTGTRRYFGYVGPETLEWLSRDLEKTDPDVPIVLCVHIPLVSPTMQTTYGSTEGMPAAEMVTNTPEVLARFEGRDLRLVLQGHLHIVEQAQVKGTKFVTAGAVSGAWWKGPFRGFAEGFMVVDIKDGAIDYHYEGYGWQAGSGKKTAIK